MKIISGWLMVVTVATTYITGTATRKSQSDPLNDIPDIPVKVARELCQTLTESGVPKNSKFLMAIVKNPVNSLGRSFPILPPRFYPGCYNWRWTKCFGESYHPLAEQCGVFSPVRIESDECGHVIKTDLPAEKGHKTAGGGSANNDGKSKSCPCVWPCISFFDPIQRCTSTKVKREDKVSNVELNSWPLKPFYLDHTQAAQLCLAMERAKSDRSFQLRFVPVPLATNDKVEESPEACIQWTWLPCNGSIKQSETDLENSFGRGVPQSQEKQSKCKKQKCNIWKKTVKSSSKCDAFKDSSGSDRTDADDEGSVQNGAETLTNASSTNEGRTMRRKLCMNQEYKDSKLCKLVAQSLGYDLVNARPIVNRKVRVQSIIQCNWFSETVFCTTVPKSLPAGRAAHRKRFTRRLKRHDYHRSLLHGITRLKRQVIIKAEVQDQALYEDTDEDTKTAMEILNPSSGGIKGQVYDEEQGPIKEQTLEEETNIQSGSRENSDFNPNEWGISVDKGSETETATISIDDEETDPEGEDEGVVEVTPEDLKRLLSYAPSSVRDQIRAYMGPALKKNIDENDSVTSLSNEETPLSRASRKIDAAGLSIAKVLPEKGTNKGLLNVYIDFPAKKVGTDKNHFYLDFPNEENGNLPEVDSNEDTPALREPRPCGIFGCFPVQTVSKDVADKLDRDEPAEHPEKGGYVACGFENGKPMCKFRMITSHKHDH